jgi:branched-chain amino acid transport system substrate-binding protein
LESYDPTLPQFNGPVSEVLAEGVEAVAVVGNRDVGPRVLAALATNGAPPQEVPTFVTSGLRTDDLGMLIDPSQPTAASGIRGVSPLAHPADQSFEDAIATASPGARTAYAAYAYDCVNLLALAAQAAESDDAEEIQPEITAVSTGGSSCRRFALCAELLAQGRSINLDGASGDLDLQDDGDVGVAYYDVFEYDEQGVDVSTEVITVRDEIA